MADHKTVHFMSRRDFLKRVWRPSDVRALISINNDSEELHQVARHLGLPRPSPKRMFVHLSIFPDDDRGMESRVALSMFDFIKNNQDKNIYVHCEMGVSRSAAVAKFIQDQYGHVNPNLKGYSIYNKRVYRQLQAAAGDSFESYKAHLIEQEEQDRCL